jgi:hypothetical protein
MSSFGGINSLFAAGSFENCSCFFLQNLMDYIHLLKVETELTTITTTFSWNNRG